MMMSWGMDEDAAPRKRIKRGTKVAESLAQEIVREIVARKLEPGTVLPSEAEMIEEYGVGRGSLREALRILEVHGLITMKPGRHGGPMLIEVGTRDYGRMSTLFYHLGGVTFGELMDARLVLEPMMARIAAQRNDPSLEKRLAEADDPSVVDDEGAYFAATHDFHQRVAAMSGNPILNLVTLSLEHIFHDQVSGLLFPRERRDEVMAAHQAIARAIAKGRAAEAERLMRQHMQEYADFVRRRHPHLVNEVVDWR
ncbi:FadR/GntR family transcriptional regulator [Actinoallomurus sp. CA-150999]|uniref:FadR/GntR family transcriptional regulator n=1 Tax=Actinoallomurus sp. CA-150999 TaxID=3239887 RepID=UPI003D8AFFB7